MNNKQEREFKLSASSVYGKNVTDCVSTLDGGDEKVECLKAVFMIDQLGCDYYEKFITCESQAERNEVVSKFCETSYKIVNELSIGDKGEYEYICDYIKSASEKLSNYANRYTYDKCENQQLYEIYGALMFKLVRNTEQFRYYQCLLWETVTDFSKTPYTALSTKFVRLATEYFSKCSESLKIKTNYIDVTDKELELLDTINEKIREIRYKKIMHDIGKNTDLWQLCSYEWCME